MTLEQAIKTRILEILTDKKISLTNLCLQSNVTPSTIFDFMNGRSKCPVVKTIKKLCCGAGLTLAEFFSREYFDSCDEVFE